MTTQTTTRITGLAAIKVAEAMGRDVCARRGGRSFTKTATAEEASAVIEWALAQLGRTKAEAS